MQELVAKGQDKASALYKAAVRIQNRFRGYMVGAGCSADMGPGPGQATVTCDRQHVIQQGRVSYVGRSSKTGAMSRAAAAPCAELSMAC